MEIDLIYLILMPIEELARLSFEAFGGQGLIPFMVFGGLYLRIALEITWLAMQNYGSFLPAGTEGISY